MGEINWLAGGAGQAAGDLLGILRQRGVVGGPVEGDARGVPDGQPVQLDEQLVLRVHGRAVHHGVERGAKCLAAEIGDHPAHGVGCAGDDHLARRVDVGQEGPPLAAQPFADGLGCGLGNVDTPEIIRRVGGHAEVLAGSLALAGQATGEEGRLAQPLEGCVVGPPRAQRPEHARLAHAVAEGRARAQAELLAQDGGEQQSEDQAGLDHAQGVGAQGRLVLADVGWLRGTLAARVEPALAEGGGRMGQQPAHALVQSGEELEQFAAQAGVGAERAGVDEGQPGLRAEGLGAEAAAQGRLPIAALVEGGGDPGTGKAQFTQQLVSATGH